MSLRRLMHSETLFQFIKFGVVGLSNTLLGYLIYIAALKFLRRFRLFPNTDLFLAQIVMFLLSVLWSFYWNNKIVFQSGRTGAKNILPALLKTYASYALTSLFLSEALLVLWVRILGISAYVAPIINLLISVPLNFLLQKFWAFRDPAKEAKQRSVPR